MGVRYTPVFLVLFTILLQSPPCRGAEYDFRSSRWGMNRIEVMSLEKLSPESFSKTYIAYRDRIIGREVDIIYKFLKNKLLRAYYSFTTHTGKDYLKIRKILEKKYGPPTEERDAGASDYLFVWETDTTLIELKPGKAEEAVVEYNSLMLQYLILEQQAEREKALLKLF